MIQQKTMWLVLRLQKWEDFATTHESPLPFPVKIDAGAGCVGWLPVYEAISHAERDYPGAQIMAIEADWEQP